MRRTQLTALIVMALAGSTSARGLQFSLAACDGGGTPWSTNGSPITWTGGPAYNPGAGSASPPTAQQIAGLPNLQWDSYWSLDNVGPSTPASSTTATDGYSALRPFIQHFPTSSPTTPFGPNSLAGIWGNNVWIPSGEGDRVFIGQITLPAASVLSTAGLAVLLSDRTSEIAGHEGLVRFGAENASSNFDRWANSYYLDVVRTPAPLGGQFSGYVTNAIYLQAKPFPAPGTGLGLALVGFAWSRRVRKPV